MEVEVSVPDDAVGAVNGDLNSRRGRLQGMEPVGRDDLDQGRGADGGDPHVLAGADLADRRPRRLPHALPALRGGSARTSRRRSSTRRRRSWKRPRSERVSGLTTVAAVATCASRGRPFTAVRTVCDLRADVCSSASARSATHADGENFVDVCPLCQDIALEHGWVKEGSPTTPVVNDRAAQAARAGSPRLLGESRRADGRAGRRRADPAPAVRARAGDGRGGRALQRERLPAHDRRDRQEPRRAEGVDRAAVGHEQRGRPERRLGHLLVPVPRHSGLGPAGAARRARPRAARAGGDVHELEREAHAPTAASRPDISPV